MSLDCMWASNAIVWAPLPDGSRWPAQVSTAGVLEANGVAPPAQGEVPVFLFGQEQYAVVPSEGMALFDDMAAAALPHPEGSEWHVAVAAAELCMCATGSAGSAQAKVRCVGMRVPVPCLLRASHASACARPPSSHAYASLAIAGV